MVPLCHFSRIPAKQLPTRFRAKLTSFFVCLSRPWIWGAVFLLGLLVMVAVVLLAVMAKRKGGQLSACVSQQGSSGPVSATPAFEAGNLGLLPLQMGFGKCPQALQFPWLKGGGQRGDSMGGGLGRDRNCRG